MRLSEALLDKKYKIKKLELTSRERRRILDLGFSRDEIVMAIYRGIFNNPTAFLIKGSIIALRDETSNKIIIGDLNEEKDSFSWES